MEFGLLAGFYGLLAGSGTLSETGNRRFARIDGHNGLPWAIGALDKVYPACHNNHSADVTHPTLGIRNDEADRQDAVGALRVCVCREGRRREAEL